MDANPPFTFTDLTAVITAVGALGTAAFGLVDALKALPGGGISHVGFKFIRSTVKRLAPSNTNFDAQNTGLSQAAILQTLKSQWINGRPTADQVSIAKSLINLRLTPATSDALAKATGVDSAALKQIAAKIQTGTPLTTPQTPIQGEAPPAPPETDTYGRYNLLLTALLDEAYQRGSQRYRNAAKMAAIPVAVILAVVAAIVVPNSVPIPEAILIGLIATPIAPVAKDLASALSVAAQAVQARKG